MASSSDASTSKSYEVTTVEATGLAPVRLKFGRPLSISVQIDAGNRSWTTPGVQWRKNGIIRWDDKIILPPLAPSTKVSFSLFRDKTLIGRAEIDLTGALAKSEVTLNEDAVLSLQRKYKETGKLTVRVSESSTAALSNVADRLEGATANLTAPAPTTGADIASATGDAVTGIETSKLPVKIAEGSPAASSNVVDHLEAVTANLAAPAPTTAADIATATADAVASIVQSDLVGSLTSVLGSMDVLLTLGDTIAKVHPWVGLAWSVLSVGLKLVKAQQDRNEKIAALIETIQSLYLIVVGAQNLADERIQNILERVLKQTVICAFFLQEYGRRGFTGKALTGFLASTDALVAGYQATFVQLREEFTGRIATQTALNIDTIATTVNDIRSDQLLDKLRPAAMDQNKRGICLPKTRQDVIKLIMDWYSDGSEGRESVMWLHGLAGAGKSTLSNTIARMMGRADGINLLGAFFFFDRSVPEANASTVIRTIAYQLAQFDPTIGAKIEQIIKGFPDIASQPLAVQFSNLLSIAALGDVPWSRGPVLVIIDALDESGSEAERQDLMRTLSEGVSQLPPFLRLLIVSRRERDILQQFKRSMIRCEELRIDTKIGQEDINAFIRSRLHEIREANIDYIPEALKDWPDDDEVNALGGLASGHFIWAATACRMIALNSDPKKAMRELLEHQSADSSANSFASLHQLYRTALQSSQVWADPSFCTNFRSILGVIVCAQVPLSCIAIDSVLASRLPSPAQHLPSLQTVSRFGSVIDWSKTGPIRILHASFYDYLTTDDRAEPWAIDVEQCKVQLAYGCIALLEQQLRENMCNLVLPIPVAENSSLPEGITYASKFWVEHVCSITDVPCDLADAIYHFLQIHLLHWMEAISIMKAPGLAIHSLSRLLQWTQKHSPKSQLYHLVHDAHRFAQYFSSTIHKHPLLIYTSAIPFTPHDTLIYKTFHNNTLPHVVSGLDSTWPPLLQVLRGHEESVKSVCFSPDGSKIASGSGDGTIHVWDAVTGQPAMPPLQGHHWVQSVCFSPDGSKIASGSVDKTVRVWDAVTGQPAMPPLQGHEEYVQSVCFSPDGSKIASGSVDKTVRVWDAVTGQPAMPPLQGHEYWVYSVCFSPDGSKIASGSEDQTIRVWNAVTGQPAMPPLQGHESYVLSVCFSPDGSKVVSGSSDKTIRVWDAVTGQPAMPPLQGHEEYVYSVCFSPDGSKIASGSVDQTVRVWNAVTGQPAMPPLQGHEGDVRSVCFSPDGSKVASGSEDKTIRLWDVVTQPATMPLPQGHTAEVTCASFSQDGSMIASGSEDGTLGVWDAFTGQAVFPSIQDHEQAVKSICFSSDRSKFASGSNDGTVGVWDAVTGQAVLPRIAGHNDAVDVVVFSSGGSKIISGSNNSIRVWDTATGRAALSPLQGLKDYAYFVAHSLSVTAHASESDYDGPKSVSVPDIVASQSLTGETSDAPVHRDHAKAPVILGLDKNGYFIDTNSDRYLGKLPDRFAFLTPEYDKSSCIGWKKTLSGLHIPVIIHFPS